MQKYIIIFAVFITSCVQVAQLNMDGTPVKPGEVIVYEEAPQVEEEFVYEVNPMKNYFSCQKDSLNVKYYARTLEMKINNPIGQCFGIWFAPRTVSDSVMVSFNAKYTGSDTLDLVAGFTDAGGGSIEATDQLQTIFEDKNGFKTFTYTFDELSDTAFKELNKANVETVIIYLNTQKKTNLKGHLTVKDIKID